MQNESIIEAVSFAKLNYAKQHIYLIAYIVEYVCGLSVLAGHSYKTRCGMESHNVDKQPQHNFSINPYKTNQYYHTPNSAVGSAPVLLPSDVRSESQVRGSFLILTTFFFFCVLESFQ